jgi:hypothetical protein
MQATRTAMIRRALLLSVLLLPTSAYAVNWNMGHEHTEGAGTAGPRYNMPDGSISQHDAATIQDYYRSLAASARCPAGSIPGAAGCSPAAPPGHWVAGQHMSGDVAAEPLPPGLAARLSPFDGYHYVRHGGDVLLVVNGTDIVAAGMAIPVR